MGDRPQLRRVRSARERRHRRDVRRRPRLAAEGSLLGDHRAPRRDDLLHGADGDPRVHALGHRMAREARSPLAAPARIGRRADQSRSVGLVSPEHRPRALPDRRHVVADRDRHDHDHAAAGHHEHEAGLRDAGVPRGVRRDPGSEGQPRREGRRPAHADEAVARHAARHLRRSRAVREAVLEPVARRRVLSPATARASTTTASTGCSAAWTTC